MSYSIRTIQAEDHDTVAAQICHHWTLTRLGYTDSFIETYGLPGFVAVENQKVIGALTWRPYEDCLQVVTLVSEQEGRGIGSILLKESESEARWRKRDQIDLVKAV